MIAAKPVMPDRNKARYIPMPRTSDEAFAIFCDLAEELDARFAAMGWGNETVARWQAEHAGIFPATQKERAK